jgi:TrmH family RNA methyltransferase
MGAIFKTKIVKIDNCVEFVKNCKNAGRRVLAAALTDESLKLGKYETKRSDVIVIGNEGHGISEDIISECTFSLMIPMTEGTESLNASVAASVILWEYAR